jgi:NADP-dependent 3-hydroxy acid dehydrogenase YdfG
MAGSGDGALVRRIAVVTGASRGIGLATARRLTALGARVVMLARGREQLEREAASLPGALALACDVGDRVAVQEAAESIANEVGTPDVLVNNAGLFALSAVERTDPDEFARTLETNLVAPFTFVRAFLGAMRERGSGHVVTVGSIADRATFPENGAYAASKYGARALHEVMRAELRGSGVRASLVSPGPTDTPLWDPIGPDTRAGFTPRAAMLSPDAVADAIAWTVTRDPAVNVDELRLSRS